MNVRRGDIFYADLSPVVGSEQGGLRPVLIVQNDMGNKYSPTVIAAAITSRLGKAKLPTHIDVSIADSPFQGLARDSVVLLEQVRTLDKRRLRERMGRLSPTLMGEVDRALLISLGLVPRDLLKAQTHGIPDAAAAGKAETAAERSGAAEKGAEIVAEKSGAVATGAEIAAEKSGAVATGAEIAAEKSGAVAASTVFSPDPPKSRGK